MSFNYTQFVANLANMLVIPVNDPNYQQAVSTIIDDSEQRLYRELDLLNTVVRDTSAILTANTRNFILPQAVGRFVIVEAINIFNPTRTALVPTSREFLDWAYSAESALTSPSFPIYYAMITDQVLIVGPAPDAAYPVEVVGTIRPTPLSASNPTTYLSINLPDLFMCEALIFGYGYMKDFGAMADDPQGGASWAVHYKDLWQSANTEEQRKRYASMAWTAKQPTPIATPARA